MFKIWVTNLRIIFFDYRLVAAIFRKAFRLLSKGTEKRGNQPFEGHRKTKVWNIKMNNMVNDEKTEFWVSYIWVTIITSQWLEQYLDHNNGPDSFSSSTDDSDMKYVNR